MNKQCTIQKILKILALIPGLSLFLQTAFAQEAIQIELFAAVNTVEVGASFSVTARTLQENSARQIQVRGVEISGLENFQQRGTSSSNQIAITNGQTKMMGEHQYLLVPKKEGQFTIGPAELSYTDEAGNTKTIRSNTLEITVTKAPIAEQKESSSPIPKKKPLSSAQWIERIALFLLAAFLIGGALYWRKLSSSSPNEEKNEELPSKEIVLPQTDDPQFFTKISALVREYLEVQSIPVQGKTTSEIQAVLKKHKHAHSQIILEILESCDLYRFARQENDADEVLQKTRKILF